MANGDIKVLQEDTGNYTEIVLTVSDVAIGGGGGGTSGHRVRYFDPFGTLIDTQYIADGENATAPTPPTLSLLTFYGWNHPGTNITRPEDIGGVYDTTDGKTYIYVQVNALTGLQPTLYFQKSTADEMTIDWGDTTDNSTTSTGNLNIQKTAAYAAAGNYTITITCAGGYNLGQGSSATTLFGNYTSNNYTSIAYKVYFGANTSLLNANLFYNYYGLDYVVASSGLTGDIGSYAFAYCYSLVSLNLPSGMTGAIGASAFRSCYSLTSLTLPSGLTGAIGSYAVYYCYSLTSLTLPSGMTSIAANAFSNNTKADEYIFQSTTPPTAADTTIFAAIQLWTKIYVPDANVNDYKTATNWTTYADYIYSINDRP